MRSLFGLALEHWEVVAGAVALVMGVVWNVLRQFLRDRRIQKETRDEMEIESRRRNAQLRERAGWAQDAAREVGGSLSDDELRGRLRNSGVGRPPDGDSGGM